MHIYVSSVSLRETIMRSELTVFDLPQFVVDQGYAGVEIQDRQLVGFEKQHIEHLARCAQAAKCGVVLDIGCDLTLQNKKLWQVEINHTIHSIELADILGAPVVRISLGGQTVSIQKLIRRLSFISDKKQTQSTNRIPKQSLLKAVLQSQFAQVAARQARMTMPAKVLHLEAKLNRAVDALKIIMSQSRFRGVKIAIENHWGITSRPEWIMQIIEDVDDPNLGVCLDFGNFPSSVDRYKGSELLAQKAFHVQAKCWRFDENGEETSVDFRKLLKILKDQYYDRIISIEYEGGKQELDSCRQARELIRKYWDGTV